MRRLFILLTVCTLILVGCGGQIEKPITESQSMETTSQVEETETAEIVENEDVDIAEVESTEESVQADAEGSKVEPEPTTEPENHSRRQNRVSRKKLLRHRRKSRNRNHL